VCSYLAATFVESCAKRGEVYWCVAPHVAAKRMACVLAKSAETPKLQTSPRKLYSFGEMCIRISAKYKYTCGCVKDKSWVDPCDDEDCGTVKGDKHLGQTTKREKCPDHE
jgi:hypothetical protein